MIQPNDTVAILELLCTLHHDIDYCSHTVTKHHVSRVATKRHEHWKVIKRHNPRI